jgi:hypothetical protein
MEYADCCYAEHHILLNVMLSIVILSVTGPILVLILSFFHQTHLIMFEHVESGNVGRTPKNFELLLLDSMVQVSML